MRFTKTLTAAALAIGGFAVATVAWSGPGIQAALIVLTVAGVAQWGWLRFRAAGTPDNEGGP